MAEKKESQVVNLDLDALEKERPKELFSTRVEGRTITFRDPRDIDWQVMNNLGEDPVEFMEELIEDDDERDHMLGLTIPGWKIDKLVEAVMKHYGLGPRGNRAGSRR